MFVVRSWVKLTTVYWPEIPGLGGRDVELGLAAQEAKYVFVPVLVVSGAELVLAALRALLNRVLRQRVVPPSAWDRFWRPLGNGALGFVLAMGQLGVGPRDYVKTSFAGLDDLL